MRGRLWAALIAAVLLLRGAGVLPDGQEMEELTLITALGLDGGEIVEATAVTGIHGEREAEVLTGVGVGPAAACRDMELSRPTRAYLGQARQLLLGEELARERLGEVLDFILTDGSLRLDTLLYIVRGKAGPGLAASLELASDGETAARRGRTVGELLARLAEGERVPIPALAPGEDGRLAPAGWAVAGPEGVEDFLDGDAARGTALLLGLGRGDVIALPQGAAELTQVRCGAVRGTLRCRIAARTAEGSVDVRLLELWAEGCIRAALARGADLWGLERMQRMTGGERPVGALDIMVTGSVEER